MPDLLTQEQMQEEAERENSDALQALFRIAETVGGSGDAPEKLNAVLEIVREVCGAMSTRLAEPDGTEDGVRIVASAGHWASGEQRHRSVTAALTTGEPRVIDGSEGADYFGEASRGAGVKSRGAFPIVLNGRVRSVLTINASTAGFFTRERMRFLRGITDSLGPLLENIRLQEAERAQSRTIDALYRITASLSSERLEDGAGAALESVRDLLGLRGCALWVPDKESQELHRFAEAHVEGPRVAAPILDFHEKGTVGRAYMTAEPVIENDYPPSAHAKRSGRKDRTRAAASFPIIEQGQVIAVATYWSHLSHAFDEPTLALLRATTEAFGTSFGRGRLRQIERQNTDALRALHSIARVLAEPGSFVDQMTAVLEEVKTVLEVDSADLRMPDAERPGLRVVASVGSALQPLGTFRAYEDSRSGSAFQQGKPIVAHDYEVNHRGGPDRGRRFRSGYEAQSVAWLPVKATSRTMAVLAVDTARRNHFTPERVQLLTTIADGIGVFIENAKLREAERLHLQELEVLNRAATIFAGGGTFRERARKVVKAIVEVIGDWATLRVSEEVGGRLSLSASTRSGSNERHVDAIGRSGTHAGQALSRRKPIIVNDYTADPRARQPAIDYGVRSRAVVPIEINGLPRAVLAVSSRLPNYFTPQRVGLLATIAAGIGPSLERARLEEEASKRQSELSRALRELQVSQQQLIQSGKLAAIGELVSGVAHEINNPLGGILGHTELLLRADVGTDREGSLQAIHEATGRISKIVQNLLSFAREREPQKELRTLKDALTPILELRRVDLRKEKIELIVDVALDLPAVMVDIQQFEQVFLNIINNAQQAMATAHGRGRLTIRGRRLKRAVRMTFADDGPGMSTNTLQHAFDPFFTTKDVGEGTGLGLSICYGIVAEHGGTIWAKSPKGKGTTVGVEVPLPEWPAARAE